MHPRYRQKKTPQDSNVRQRGIRNGYRSGLEEKIAKQIEDAGKEVSFETDRIYFEVPPRQARYTPDFKLPKLGGFFYVETKGIWDTADRQKHLLIKKQYPEIDIRFVFSSANKKINKGSKTTYAAFCEKNGLTYAHRTIPAAWLEE